MTTNNIFSTIVVEVLRDDNYAKWSACVKTYLLAQDLWDIVEATTEPPKPEDGEEDYKVWRKKNAAALRAIHNSCGPEMLSHVMEMSSANIAWETLAKLHETQSLQNQDTAGNISRQQQQEEKEVDNQPQSTEINNPSYQEIPSVSHETQLNPTASRVNSGTETGTEDDEYAEFQPLVQVINSGDLDAVKDFMNQNPNAKSAEINDFGFTALHVAIMAGKDEIAEELVKIMSPEELEIQDNSGDTALHLAAVAGNVKIAKCIISENNNTLAICDETGDLPIISACAEGRKKMTRYLYSLTPHQYLDGAPGSLLLWNALMVKLFDVALDLIRKYPHLATVPSRFGFIPLQSLAGVPSLFPSSIQLTFWKRILFGCIHAELPSSSNDFYVDTFQKEKSDKYILRLQVIGQIQRIGSTLLKIFGIEELYHMKLNQLYAMEILNCMCQKLPTTYNLRVGETFGIAIKLGTVEIFVRLCKLYPDLLYESDENERTIFFTATLLRQEKIFNLIYGLIKRKNSVVDGVDKFNNCLLHLAGMLAPPSYLTRIPGAALKMQRELQWYKEVQSLVGPSAELFYNDNGELPHEVFTKEHKDLMKQGEKWLKDNATSCSFVAALIITIMFAAAFTIPGDNDQNTGYPIFLYKTPLQVFAISDAVSLFTSTISVLTFLEILTARYKEEDFLKTLPTKFILGLSTLFISIAAMVVAFCAALIIMFKGQLNIIIPSIALATFPITTFVWLQFPLLVEIFTSTYGPGIFDKKLKPWL